MKGLNNSNNNKNFMNRYERRILYSIIGFLGGILIMSKSLDSNMEYYILGLMMGGILLAWVGYKIATR